MSDSAFSTTSPRLPGVLNLPLGSIPFSPPPNNKHTSSIRRRRPHDEVSYAILKMKEVDDGRTGRVWPGGLSNVLFEHP
jgi:hypothetical protein